MAGEISFDVDISQVPAGMCFGKHSCHLQSGPLLVINGVITLLNVLINGYLGLEPYL